MNYVVDQCRRAALECTDSDKLFLPSVLGAVNTHNPNILGRKSAGAEP